MALGGKRPGSGRKPKADEIKLIEQMDSILKPDVLWENLSVLVKNGDIQAIKLWLSYRFGQPKQNIDVKSDGEKIMPQFTVSSPEAATELNKLYGKGHTSTDDEGV